MANISLTSECNRSCVYCFAQAVFGKAGKKSVYMSREIFTQALAFLKRSRINQIRLLGGEPTLHPDFPFFIDMALAQGLPILIFSNGQIDLKMVDFLQSRIKNGNITFLINISEPGESTLAEKKNWQDLFLKFGPAIMLGINIYKPGCHLDFLIDTIVKYQLKKYVRLGIAHPCVGFDNLYLLPQFFRQVGEKIISFASQAKPAGIDINFDCGIVPCMFAGFDLEIFGKNVEQIGNRCGPIVDILPDGRITPCYPLSKLFSLPLTADINANSVREIFGKGITPYGQAGIFRECSLCRWKDSGFCAGGCIATVQKRIHRPSFSIKVKNDV